MAEESSADETPITFHIKSSADAKYEITMPLSATVLDLKTKLSSSEYADIPPDRQRLIYSGRVLKDPDSLATNKIKEGHTIHLVKGAASNQRQNPANASASTSTAGATGQPATGVPTNLATGTGNNPLAGLTGARYAGFAQLPNSSMFGPDGGMGPPPDPEHVIRMMQNPQFASTIDEALSNPQILDMMIQQNPMLRDMPGARQMMQSPEFRRMLTNPESMRQMAQMRQWMGGVGMGDGPGGGNNAFPAPGVTDTTPSNGQNQTGNTGSQPPNSSPFNPFAMLGDPLGAGTGAGTRGAANPFAALFQPAPNTGTTPTSSPPPSSAIPNPPPTTNSSNPSGSAGSNTTPQPQLPNPFANPFLQNPAYMQQLMTAMNPQNTQWPSSTNPPTNANNSNNATGTQGQQQAANPFATLFGPGGPMAGGGGPGGLPPWMQGMAGAGTLPSPADTRPPEVRYEEQLRQLNAMGFYEFERNVEALRRMGGSVEGAVEWLLRG